jgi:Ca2+-transporting ATPase
LNDIISDRKVSVVRNGACIQISIFDVVVGDIVLLEAGEFVPCDGLFIKGNSNNIFFFFFILFTFLFSKDVGTDQASITGETKTVKKGESDPFLLGTSKVELFVCFFFLLWCD